HRRCVRRCELVHRLPRSHRLRATCADAVAIRFSRRAAAGYPPEWKCAHGFLVEWEDWLHAAIERQFAGDGLGQCLDAIGGRRKSGNNFADERGAILSVEKAMKFKTQI